MKYCPKCGERFDEEIIKFCTKDGTPLIEQDEPKFTEMPSRSGEDEGDIGEETVIRRKPFETSGPSGPERFVIPTSDPASQHVRPRPSAAYYPPPPPQNTGKIIALTILGTVFVLACGAGLFWLLQSNEPANLNANINTNMPNINLNTNIGFDSNFNFNAANINTNISLPNMNIDFNTNIRPSPSPRATPTPRPSPTPSPVTQPNPRQPSNTPPSNTPRMAPRPPMANRPSNGN